ncbi:MAG: MBL fold metallo-hydrolase [Candidatus Zixiibacteriota bacterium]
MLRFQVIGCSSGVPHKNLACSGYLLKQNNRHILFDCGEGANSAMRRLDLDPRKIDSIFISHMHPDHCMGLPLFVQANYVLKRRSRLDIFVPFEAVRGIRNLFDLTYLYALKLPFELEVHPFYPDSTFEMTDLKITARQNTHLSRHKELIKAARKSNRMLCYSFSILAGKSRIVYSGDIGSEKDLVGLIDNCDLLVVEQSHVDLAKLGEMIRSHRIKKTLVTHLNEQFDLRKTKRLLGGMTNSKLIFAHEGLVIDVF